MVEGRILCALTERIKAIKKKRCMKIDKEAIDEGNVSAFQSESRILAKVEED